jgi:hypothetical protein
MAEGLDNEGLICFTSFFSYCKTYRKRFLTAHAKKFSAGSKAAVT